MIWWKKLLVILWEYLGNYVASYPSYLMLTYPYPLQLLAYRINCILYSIIWYGIYLYPCIPCNYWFIGYSYRLYFNIYWCIYKLILLYSYLYSYLYISILSYSYTLILIYLPIHILLYLYTYTVIYLYGYILLYLLRISLYLYLFT